ncbi:MAG: ribosome maturation factor RimP [Gammaproteobacteria bacterium]|nr:ribosome maturation factor RimP [Gammaproteobacteria bacterium]MDE2022869.1 ribosome maturation factor RimP [Gammaproteobacteria bacterium]
MRETLLRIIEPAVNGLGYELVDLEFQGKLLRLYIDQPQGVTLDDCEQVSRQISAVLDVADPIPGAYTLEVSSPGLDRPLRKPADFSAQAGKRARIELTLPLNGRRRFAGTLRGVEHDEVLIEVDGAMFRLPCTQIAKARLAPEF